MNNKVYIVDKNGNQIIAEGISYITLKGDGFSNDYLFYTLNELVNGDLNKVYVAKVSEVDKIINDEEWNNVKRVMLAIVHGETVEGMSYNSIFDEKGEGKTFNIDTPRKIAIKLDKLTGLRDNYKLAITNPNSNDNVAAVGNTENVVTTEVVTDTPVQNEVKVEEVTAPVVEQTTEPVKEETNVNVESANVVPTPEVQTTTVVETPVTSVTVEEPKEEIKPVEEIPSISPMPIPDVVLEEKKEDSFAIPVSTPQVQTNEENDVFNEIIKELKSIKTQNEEIKESIRKLTNNIANINTSLSGQEIKKAQGNYDGMINTNMANTTEDVSAIDITSNGTVVIPSFAEAQKSAINSANVISNSIINTAAPTIDTAVQNPTILEQPLNPQPNVVEETPVPANPIESLANSPVAPPSAPVAQPVQPVIEQPVIPEPVVSNSTPAPVTTNAVNSVPELPQILPDVPMADDKTNPNIIVPDFDPNAGLPPVQMPTGVSAGNDSSAVGSTIAG